MLSLESFIKRSFEFRLRLGKPFDKTPAIFFAKEFIASVSNGLIISIPSFFKIFSIPKAYFPPLYNTCLLYNRNFTYELQSHYIFVTSYYGQDIFNQVFSNFAFEIFIDNSYKTLYIIYSTFHMYCSKKFKTPLGKTQYYLWKIPK